MDDETQPHGGIMSILGSFLGGASGAAVGQLVVKIVADSTGIQAGFADAKKSAKGFVDSIMSGQGLTTALGAIGPAAIAGVAVAGIAAVSAALVDCTAKAAEFETGMATVMTQLPGAGKEVEEKLTGVIRDLQREMGVLSTDSIPAMYDALSAGVSEENIDQFMTTASKMAIGGLIDTGTAVDGLTSAVNAYGPDVLDVEKASDILFTTIRLGKVDMAELATSLSNVTPLAAAAGVGLDQVGAAVATLTMSGTKTSVATTQLRALFSELSKSSSQVSGVFEQAFGKTFLEYMGDGGTLQGALTGLSEYAENSGKSVIDLFGSVEAGSAALTLTTSGAATFTDALQQMNDSAGATEGAFQTMDNTLERTGEKMGAKVEGMMQTVGAPIVDLLGRLAPLADGALGAISVIVEKIISALTWVADRSPIAIILRIFEDPRIQDAYSKLGEALGKLMTALSGTGDETDALMIIIDKLVDLMVTVGVPVILGLAGAITAIANVIPNAQSAVGGFGQTISDTFAGAYDAVVGVIDGVKQTISDAWEWIWNGVTAAWDSLVNWFWGGIDSIRNGILAFAAEPVRFITEGVAGVIDAVDSGIGLILTGIEAFGQGIADFFAGIWNGIIQGAEDWANGMLSVIDPVADFFGFEVPEIDLSGYQITAPTISINRPEALKNASSAVRGTGQNIVNTIYQTNNFPENESPYESARRIAQENRNLWRNVL